MWNNGKASFRSTHYPTSKSAFLLTQEYAMRYYVVLLFILSIISVIRISNGKEMLIFSTVSAVVALALGNLLANVKLRRSIAEILFVNDGFAIISVHDILHQNPRRSFPLRWANPTRSQDIIEFHFEDQIMTIRREDWDEEFDLIWNWFVSGTVEMGAAPVAEDL